MVWFDVMEPVSVNTGGVEPHVTVSGEAGELVIGTVMVGWAQVTENLAAFEDAAVGLVMTMIPDPVALSEGAVTAAEATGRLPALAKSSVSVGPFPAGSSQWYVTFPAFESLMWPVKVKRGGAE